MAETIKNWMFNTTIPIAETSVLQLFDGLSANVSIANLPQPAGTGQNVTGPKAVRIRGTVNVLNVPGAAVTVSVRQGQTVTGTLINGQPAAATAAAPVTHASIPFEVVDTQPPVPLQYNVTLASGTSTGTCNITAEMEVIQ